MYRTDTGTCVQNRYRYLCTEQVQVPVYRTDTGTCVQNRYRYLCTEQIQVPVYRTGTGTCVQNRYRYLCTEQVQVPVYRTGTAVYFADILGPYLCTVQVHLYSLQISWDPTSVQNRYSCILCRYLGPTCVQNRYRYLCIEKVQLPVYRIGTAVFFADILGPYLCTEYVQLYSLQIAWAPTCVQNRYRYLCTEQIQVPVYRTGTGTCVQNRYRYLCTEQIQVPVYRTGTGTCVQNRYSGIICRYFMNETWSGVMSFAINRWNELIKHFYNVSYLARQVIR